MSGMIEFNEVCKVYPNGVEAVRDLSFEVAEGETLVLLGSSGCGKTTTMKMVNRLIDATSGEIRIEGEAITDREAVELRRTIGYAIQHVGLFPHMTIAENIAVVPKLRKWDRERIAERVDRLLTLIGLEPEDFASRYPNQLSGGQRQRVGVARALAADPPIVLMDEPFGALDPLTREQLQDEFIDLESEIQKTVLFVTHDIFEAVKMGDRIALLDEGQLQQLAPPAELVETPANAFVDHFLGQHRFQLSLLTQTIAPIVEETEKEVEAPGDKDLCLNPRNSLIEALDLFKKTGRTSLPVVKRGEVTGRLTKRRLLTVITKALEDTGEGS